MQNPRNVLLVGRDRIKLLQLRSQLECGGATTIIANANETAVALFREYRFPVVIVDLNGIDEAGLRMGERIHSGERSPDTVVVFVRVAKALIERLKVTYNVGIAEFLPPDEAIQEIARKVNGYCDEHRAATTTTIANPELSPEALSEFYFAVSHDLMDPLRGQRAYLELLSNSAGAKLDADESRWLEVIESYTVQMNDLVRGLHNLVKISGSESVVRPGVNCENIVTRALSLSRLAIDDNQALIMVESLPEVKSNETLLLQIFHNLIGNALKYRSNARPVIRVFCEEKGKDWRFAVADNGIGIDPAYLEYVFQPLKRLEKRASTGAGLGLAVCRTALKRLGGRIWAESTPGKGATFYFTIPRAAEDRFAAKAMRKHA